MEKNEINNYEEYEQYTLNAVEDFNKKDYEKALIKFNKMAKFHSENHKVHETLIVIHLKLNNFEDAEKEYKIMLGLMKKKNIEIYEPRPFEEVVNELEDVKSLEKEYKSLSKQKNDEIKDNAKLPIQISMQYIAKGEYEKAEKFLTKHKEKYFVNS